MKAQSKKGLTSRPDALNPCDPLNPLLELKRRLGPLGGTFLLIR